MNERIKELAEEAGFYVAMFDPGNKDNATIEKFAELIVRECAEITSGLSKLYPRTDVAFDVGYTMGTTRATKEIEQHFGLDE